MTTAQAHRSHGKARNAAHAHGKQSKPKRVVGTLRKDTEDPRSGMGDEVWHEMVSTAAHLRAEARGFEAARLRMTGTRLKLNCVGNWREPKRVPNPFRTPVRALPT